MRKKRVQQTQLELSLAREREADRNAHLGGRSFYFFDFDDNVAFLSTPLILFPKKGEGEIALSSHEFAVHQKDIGVRGFYKDYEIRWDEAEGTFRHFRDWEMERLAHLGFTEQNFVMDMRRALEDADYQWQGPSWSCFYHAVFNQRPLSIITARGHSPQTIQAGIRLLKEFGYIQEEPNYLSVYPVNHPELRNNWGAELHTAELKQRAIRESVMTAIKVYGYSPHHRFGMSDDDPKNIELIFAEMQRLKREFPEMSFFLIETARGQFIKHEVFENQIQDTAWTERQLQLSLFPEENPIALDGPVVSKTPVK